MQCQESKGFRALVRLALKRGANRHKLLFYRQRVAGSIANGIITREGRNFPMQNESYGAAWDQVIARLLSEPDGSMVAVDETDVEPPRLSGMTRMPLPSDDGRPVYGAFLDATSAFVVHHVGTTYQVKRHPFSTVAHTVQVEPPALRSTSATPRQTGRPVQREVHVERVETRHLPSRLQNPYRHLSTR